MKFRQTVIYKYLVVHQFKLTRVCIVLFARLTLNVYLVREIVSE